MKPYAKFAIVVTVVIGTLAWLAAGGISETSTYYKTIGEVKAMKPAELDKKVRVAGDVEKGSIVREGTSVRFVLIQEEMRLPVVYKGNEPLPDTFRDGAQALADGRLNGNGTFEANRIQAKCASKYEGKPQIKKQPDASRAAL